LQIPSYNIIIGNATDVGKVREQNEDYMAHFDTPFGYCILICDGMGGHIGGQIASQNAISAIQFYLQDSNNEHGDTKSALLNAIEFANFQLREMATENPSLQGMGTTCVLTLIKKGKMHTAHAGDSRAYLLRNRKLKQLTKDHSSVQKLIDVGILTEEEADLSDKKNEIDKAIGVFEKVEPTISKTPISLKSNDKIIICSDGLTTHVGKDKIMEILSSKKTVQDISQQLIDTANNGGGSDNITVQVILFNKPTKLMKKMVPVLLLLVPLFFITVVGYNKYFGNKEVDLIKKKPDSIQLQKKPINPLEKKSSKTIQKNT
jgi:PPM family protein phosphatase